MPLEWSFAEDLIRLEGAGKRKIDHGDGLRQQETARAILSALAHQPGIILADEVGMGKTYVALAVVASVLVANRKSGRPVIVMVPPGLVSKWPREWEQFKSLCCTRPDILGWVRTAHARTPTDFLKLLDDRRARRPHLVWMSTNCFSLGLQDPWTKLVLIRLARSRTRMDDETKKRLYKWATTLTRMKSHRLLTQEVIERLLLAEPGGWKHILVQEGLLDEDAVDPVPKHLLQHQNQLDWSRLTALLRGETIPGRRGNTSKGRLLDARADFNGECQELYWQWLRCVDWRAPLLVLDEAHHAKNDDTRLATLFRSDDTKLLLAGETSRAAHPLLWNKFDRLLFLTATPFQLGHQELIRVLRSFACAKWTGESAPDGSRETFDTAMTDLEKRLDEYRIAARRLDRLWSHLTWDRVDRIAGDGGESAVSAWWRRLRSSEGDNLEQEILRAVDDCHRARERAEYDPAHPWDALRTWVIRHNRPAMLPGQAGEQLIPRRQARYGGAIIDDTGDGHRAVGIPILGTAAAPFLLAARAQGELAASSEKGRVFFAEGLASSYEAFHHTHDRRGDARDLNDDTGGAPRRQRTLRVDSIVPVSWYEQQVERFIPSKAATEEARFGHPKVRAVVQRAVDLWRSGEKVLIFCFYRETARALRAHVGREVERVTLQIAAGKLGVPQNRPAEIRDSLTRFARRLGDEDSPFNLEIMKVLRTPFSAAEFSTLTDREEELLGMMAAYVRSPTFIARYLPIDAPQVRRALLERESRPDVVRAGVDALTRALTEQTDASGLSLLQRMEEFLRFAMELAERGKVTAANEEGNEEENEQPLDSYLRSVAVYVSPRRAGDDDDEEAQGQQAPDGSYRVLPIVRMVHGGTQRKVRENLMLAFNSPLFPEILISSRVLGEGVDLHRFCRHVIHHDLDWNPSVLEQCTGRLDRIRCKAEVVRRPIVVYEPFLAGSADEKMFRVVRDRERWFQIVMGQRFEFSERSSEEIANRLPLPDELARELIFDLSRSASSQRSLRGS